MKRFVRFTLCIWLLGPLVFPAQAAFTSLYIFGDGASTTTNGPGGPYFYGKRFSNGRVWVEVLAQWQGLTYDSNKNWSYYGHDSTNMLNHVTSFSAPDASNALFVVWCADADFVWNALYSGTNITTWTNALNQCLTNHFKAITNLYTKGVRTLVMPNAVDITKVPYYVYYAAANRAFIRQRAIDFNTAFAATLNQVRTSTNYSGLTIFEPDFFTLLDNILANPAAYGLTNALDSKGRSIDALGDTNLINKSLDGPGTNYIFWDNLDPGAKAHAVMADTAQQLISPVRISQITALNGANRLDVANIPIGRGGFVEGHTNLVVGGWTTVQNINSTNTPQTIFVPASGPLQFYRLRFPFAWSWP